MHLSGSGQGQVVDCCEHGTETSGSIKCGEFSFQEGIYSMELAS